MIERAKQAALDVQGMLAGQGEGLFGVGYRSVSQRTTHAAQLVINAADTFKANRHITGNQFSVHESVIAACKDEVVRAYELLLQVG